MDLEHTTLGEAAAFLDSSLKKALATAEANDLTTTVARGRELHALMAKGMKVLSAAVDADLGSAEIAVRRFLDHTPEGVVIDEASRKDAELLLVRLDTFRELLHGGPKFKAVHAALGDWLNAVDSKG